MKKTGIVHRVISIALLMLFLVSPSAKAAENRQGVIQMITMSLESAKSALESDKIGNKLQALNSLKQTEQFVKEYTDSIPATKIKKLKSSITQAKDYIQNNQMDRAGESIRQAIAQIQEIQASVK